MCWNTKGKEILLCKFLSCSGFSLFKDWETDLVDRVPTTKYTFSEQKLKEFAFSYALLHLSSSLPAPVFYVVSFKLFQLQSLNFI